MSNLPICKWVDTPIASGGTVTVASLPNLTLDGTSTVICMASAVAVLGLTVQLPIANVPDGQYLTLVSNASITGLTINAETGGLIQGLLSSLLTGGAGIYRFRAGTKTWWKVAN